MQRSRLFASGDRQITYLASLGVGQMEGTYASFSAIEQHKQAHTFGDATEISSDKSNFSFEWEWMNEHYWFRIVDIVFVFKSTAVIVQRKEIQCARVHFWFLKWKQSLQVMRVKFSPSLTYFVVLWNLRAYLLSFWLWIRKLARLREKSWKKQNTAMWIVGWDEV